MVRSIHVARLGAVALLLFSAQALARVAVLPLAGARNPALERQLSASICARLGCVPASSVTTSGRVDWAKVQRAGLDGVVVGKLSRERRPQVLEMSLLVPGGQLAWRKRFTVTGGRISPQTLVAIRDQISATVAQRSGATPRPRPAPPPSPARPAPTPPTGAPQPPAAGEIQPPAELQPPGTGDIAPPSADAIAPPPAGAATAGVATGGPARPAFVELEASAQVLHRTWTWSGNAAAAGLRSWTLSLVAEPRARVGVFPLRTAEGLVESLGLELSGAVTVGAVLKGLDPAIPKAPISLWSADAAARLRLRVGAWRLGPALAYRMAHVGVQSTSSGQRLAGIATADLRAVRAGLAVEGPIAGPVGLVAEASVLKGLSAGDAFGGAGIGVEARAGVAWHVSPPFAVTVEAVLQRQSYDAPTGSEAGSATAQAYGGDVGFRLAL